jgi:hypothetical protein
MATPLDEIRRSIAQAAPQPAMSPEEAQAVEYLAAIREGTLSVDDVSHDEVQTWAEALGGPLALAQLISDTRQFAVPDLTLAKNDPGEYIVRLAHATWPEDATAFTRIRRRAGMRFLAQAAGAGRPFESITEPERLFATRLTRHAAREEGAGIERQFARWTTGLRPEGKPRLQLLSSTEIDLSSDSDPVIALETQAESVWLRIDLDRLPPEQWHCVRCFEWNGPTLDEDGELYVFSLDELEFPRDRFSPGELTDRGFYLDAWKKAVAERYAEEVVALLVYFIFGDMSQLVAEAEKSLKEELDTSTVRRLASIPRQEIQGVLQTLAERILSTRRERC